MKNLKLESLVLAIGIALVLAPASPVAAGVLYVSSSDATCGGRDPCFSTLQAAVDAAFPGDEVRVAAGTYAGAAPGVVGSLTYYQVVLITESLTLQGGYTTGNWSTPDPAANVTIIDADSKGRCVSVIGSGTESVVLAGFTCTGGDYEGLGNPAGVFGGVCLRSGSDCGGGLLARDVQIVLRDAVLEGNTTGAVNTSSDGGGALFLRTTAGSLLERVIFSGNTAPAPGGNGGGLNLYSTGEVTLRDVIMDKNSSSGGGGGLHLAFPVGPVTIEDSQFVDNGVVSGKGGGISANLAFVGTALRIDRVLLERNSAGFGSGLSIENHSSGNSAVQMNNVMFVGNHGSGSPLLIRQDGGSLEVQARQLTFADQVGRPAVEIENVDTSPLTAHFTNTLIDNAAAAFEADQESTGAVTVNESYTLTHDVTTLHATVGGSPTFNGSNGLTGDPKLDASGHLMPGSAAIDSGTDTGVSTDIDGDGRPLRGGYDIGADEEGIGGIFFDDFESGDLTAWISSVP